MAKKKQSKPDADSKDEVIKSLREQLAAMTKLMEALQKDLAEMRSANKSEKGPRALTLALPSSSSPPATTTTSNRGPDLKPSAGSSRTDKEAGWKTIPPKGKKQSNSSLSENDKEELELRADDWKVPIITKDKITDGVNGVLLMDTKEAIELYQEIGDAFTGKLAVITMHPVDTSDAGSRQLRIKAKGVTSGRLYVVKRWLTNFGNINVTAVYEKKDEIEAKKINVVDSSIKVVLQLAKRHVSKANYESATSAPQSTIRSWLQGAKLQDSVLYSSRPLVKAWGAEEWLEAVVTIKKTALHTLFKKSGEDGVFVKPFYQKESPDDSMRVVWLGENTTLEDAWSRTQLYPAGVFGLVYAKKGLGIRVLKDNFEQKLKQFLGETEAADELKKSGQLMYEIAKIPPWVSPSDLLTALKDTFKWDCDLVRVIRGWGAKTFIVRAATKPTAEVVIIEDHWITLQPAKPRPAGKVEKKSFLGRERPASWKQRPDPKTTAAPPPAPRAQPAASSSNTTITMESLKDILLRFGEELQDKLEKRLADGGASSASKKPKLT